MDTKTGTASLRPAAALVACALLTGAAAGCGHSSGGDGIPDVSGAHRVPARAAAGASGGASAGHRWVALAKDWSKLRKASLDTVDATVADTLGTDGTRVFAVTAHHGKKFEYGPATVTAYDGAHGTTLWSTTVQWSPSTVPVGVAGVVVLTSATRSMESLPGGNPVTYVALDAATGKPLWHRTVGEPVTIHLDNRDTVPVSYLGGLLYYADGNTVFGVDPRTGAVRRQRSVGQFDIMTGPVVTGGLLAIATKPTAENFDTDRQRLVVLGPDLAPRSSYQYPDTTDTPNCADRLLGGSSGIVVSWSDEVMCGFEQRAGKVRLLWTTKLGQEHPSQVVDGVVPVFDFTNEPDNTVHGVDARTGRTLWTNQPPKSFDARSRIAVVDGTLFSLGHHVQILDPRTGRTTFDAQPRFAGQNLGGDDLPVYAGGHIVMYRADGIWSFR